MISLSEGCQDKDQQFHIRNRSRDCNKLRKYQQHVSSLIIKCMQQQGGGGGAGPEILACLNSSSDRQQQQLTLNSLVVSRRRKSSSRLIWWSWGWRATRRHPCPSCRNCWALALPVSSCACCWLLNLHVHCMQVSSRLPFSEWNWAPVHCNNSLSLSLSVLCHWK